MSLSVIEPRIEKWVFLPEGDRFFDLPKGVGAVTEPPISPCYLGFSVSDPGLVLAEPDAERDGAQDARTHLAAPLWQEAAGSFPRAHDIVRDRLRRPPPCGASRLLGHSLCDPCPTTMKKGAEGGQVCCVGRRIFGVRSRRSRVSVRCQVLVRGPTLARSVAKPLRSGQSEHMRLSGPASVALLVLVSGLVTSCSPEHTPTGERIAFTSRRGDWFSIYTIRPDGTDLTKVIDIVKVENVHTGNYLDVMGQPAWSTDGSRIAYVCPVEGRSGLCVVDSDGSDQAVLPIDAGEQDRLPSWSPEGRIAFARQYDNKRSEIFVTDIDGTEVQQLTDGEFDFDPEWSPSGEEIIFMRRIDRLNYELYVVAPDGSSVRAITQTEGAEGNPVWDPAGGRLAFIIGEPTQDIHLLDLDTGERTNLTNTKEPEGWPTWSPDGDQIAFTCGNPSGICVMNTDGSGRRQVIGGDGTLNMQPAWEPA